MPTSNQKGKLAELKVLARAIEKGYAPAIPSIDCRYDLVLDDGEKLWRVQVKYANGKPSNTYGSVVVKLEYNDRTNHRYFYKESEVDALVVYIPKINKLCWFPCNIFVGKTALSIRTEPTLNNQNNKVIFANQYYW